MGMYPSSFQFFLTFKHCNTDYFYHMIDCIHRKLDLNINTRHCQTHILHLLPSTIPTQQSSPIWYIPRNWYDRRSISRIRYCTNSTPGSPCRTIMVSHVFRPSWNGRQQDINSNLSGQFHHWYVYVYYTHGWCCELEVVEQEKDGCYVGFSYWSWVCFISHLDPIHIHLKWIMLTFFCV